MITLYVASNESYSGKTLTCIVLGTRWLGRGRKVGYFKPIGTPTPEGGPDGDSAFVASQLGLSTAPAQLIPGVLTPEFCAQGAEAARQQVLSAFAAASQGKDVMLVNGSGSVLTRGAMVGLTGPEVAEALDARVLLVAKCTAFPDLDSILVAARALGKRLIGVLLTRLPHVQHTELAAQVTACLEREGVTVLGALPEDPVLHSVSVGEIAKETGATFLTCPEAAEELIENFVIGAMTVESALHYFRRTPRKCVITGGDRGDILLAALDTPTKCLVLTGDLRPNEVVLNRARELSVPVLLVKADTLSTVATIESLLGYMRLREPAKARHAQEQFGQHVQLAALEKALGLG